MIKSVGMVDGGTGFDAIVEAAQQGLKCVLYSEDPEVIDAFMLLLTQRGFKPLYSLRSNQVRFPNGGLIVITSRSEVLKGQEFSFALIDTDLPVSISEEITATIH